MRSSLKFLLYAQLAEPMTRDDYKDISSAIACIRSHDFFAHHSEDEITRSAEQHRLDLLGKELPMLMQL